MELTDFVRAYPQKPDTMLFPELIARFPIEVSLDSRKGSDDITKAHEWVSENLDDSDFVEIAFRFFFKTETVALQFKLTWGGTVKHHT